MPKNDARISRVGNSFRVRVSGETAYFSPREHGGEEGAFAAAVAWRDARWDGTTQGRKLSPKDVAAIRKSKAHYKTVAKKYGISPNYVHYLRRGKK